MEELCVNPAMHNIQITYRMPHEVLKHRINYKYMAVEADKHVKIMFDKLETILEVPSPQSNHGTEVGPGPAKSIKIIVVVRTKYTTLKELAKSQTRFVKIKAVVRTSYFTSPFQMSVDR